MYHSLTLVARMKWYSSPCKQLATQAWWQKKSNGGHGPPYKTHFPETGNWKPETISKLETFF